MEDEGTIDSRGAPAGRVRYKGLPLVVIAGRPNAGKSTLFNRLARSRRSITDPTPGVTRDPVEEVCDLGAEFPVRVLDTGGFTLEKGGFDRLVAAKSLAAIDEADLVLFLADATSTTPEDEELAARLRRHAKKVMLAVNKADNPQRALDAMRFHSWGFGEPYPISAEHGTGVAELVEAMLPRLDFSRAEIEGEEGAPIRIAILGKPNTGKSTLLNALLGEERAIVSDVAGTTRDVLKAEVERDGARYLFLDTAGIRRKAKVREDVEYYSVNRSIRAIEDCDVVLLMIDAREGLAEQDKKIAALAVERGRGLIFVLNKWDLMPSGKKTLEESVERLRFLFPAMGYAPVFAISAKTGSGLGPLLSMARTMRAELEKRVDTGPLNQALKRWLEERPPPVGPSTRFKPRYMTQVGVNPLKFVLFVQRSQAATDAYISYLRNRLRKDLGFEHVPLFLDVRSTRKTISEREEERKRG
jgi:GTP-binding protein